MAMLRRTCPGCNGSGQVSCFKGESRFLLSQEDCPECGGMGFLISDEDGPSQKDDEADGSGTATPGKPEKA